MRNIYSKNPSIFWIVLAFIIWIITFFGFLSSRLAIFEDATSYFEHTKFFLENLLKGVYPLWDPFWYIGAPNDFFLRRIGAFNPFYSIIVLFELFKIPYTYAYLSFLALYYWGGMIAFYLLGMRLYQNRLIAYAGYLMLMFSALGTRLFDSYMMLITVPLIWFFYFLVAFSQTPARHFFLGICLSFMILVSTYIPFYFLSFLILFVIFFCLFHFKRIPLLIQKYADFIRSNKLLVVVSLVIVLFSFAPSYTFFHNSTKGQIVMPVRHGGSSTGQPLEVISRTIDWGAVEDIVFSAYFSDLHTYRFAIIYVPFFAIIVFALGLFGRISRFSAFLYITALVLLCSIIPHGLPFYDFLYKHVFFLKYFRNLHFFLWFILIPLFVLLVLEHWKMFSEIKIAPKERLIYVLVVHLLILFFVVSRVDAIVSTYVMIALSCVFWSLTALGRLNSTTWVFIFLTLTILVQPLETYYYLSSTAKPYLKGMYGYDFSYNTLILKRPVDPKETFTSSKGSLYYASASYNNVYENTDNYALAKYLQHKFILVDHVQRVDQRQVDFNLINQQFLNNDNRAIVFADHGDGFKTDSNSPSPSTKALILDKEDKDFKVLSFNANHLKLAIHVSYEKFLIFNDSYDPYWKVTINGKEGRLYQANVGFKGVWIPAGHSIVEFQYGRLWQYAMNYVLLIGAFAFLIGIIYFLMTSSRIKKN